jgi:anhydro-N-acetylmuramic acid kinase
MERLSSLIRARVTTTAELGIGVDSKEAILFALLAYQTYQGRAGNLPSATGARKPMILGKISRGTPPTPGA